MEEGGFVEADLLKYAHLPHFPSEIATGWRGFKMHSDFTVRLLLINACIAARKLIKSICLQFYQC